MNGDGLAVGADGDVRDLVPEVPRSTSPAAPSANEAFFARLEGHVSVGDGGIDQKAFQTLAVAVEKMDAKLAEKWAKLCKTTEAR